MIDLISRTYRKINSCMEQKIRFLFSNLARQCEVKELFKYNSKKDSYSDKSIGQL